MGNTASNKTHPISNNKKKKKKRKKKQKNKKQKYTKTATEPSVSTTDKSYQDEDDDNTSTSSEYSSNYSHLSSMRCAQEMGLEIRGLGMKFYEPPAPKNNNDENISHHEEYSSDSHEYSHEYSNTVNELKHEENAQVLLDYMVDDKLMDYFGQYITGDKHELKTNIQKDLSNLNGEEMKQVCKQFNVKYNPKNHHIVIKQIFAMLQKKMYIKAINDKYLDSKNEVNVPGAFSNGTSTVVNQSGVNDLLDYLEDDKMINYFSQYFTNDKLYKPKSIKKKLLKLNKNELKQICKEINVKHIPKNKTNIVNQIFAVMEKTMYMKTINDNQLYMNSENKNKLDPKGAIISFSDKNDASYNNFNKSSGGNQSQNNQSSTNSTNSNNSNGQQNNDNNKSDKNHQPNDNDEKKQNNHKKYCNVPEHRTLVQTFSKLKDVTGQISSTQRQIMDDQRRIMQNQRQIIDNMQFHDAEHDDVKLNDNNQEEKKTMLEDNKFEYKIKICKKLTTETIFEIIKEKLTNPYEYFQHCERMYGVQQIINSYENQSIAFADYDIHCKKTSQKLYITCEIINGKYKYKQTVELCTHEMIQKRYGILCKSLPKRIIPRLLPDLNLMKTFTDVLQNKKKRKTQIDETEWSKIPVTKCVRNIKRIKQHQTSCRSIQVEHFKIIMHTFADKMPKVVLIPIVLPDKDKILQIQYAWVVQIVHGNIKFHIGIILELPNNHKCKTPLNVSAIFLSLYDAYHLIPAHLRNIDNGCLDDFICHDHVNYLRIGTEYEHKIDEQQKHIEKLHKKYAIKIETLRQQLTEQIDQNGQLKNTLKISNEAYYQQMVEFVNQMNTLSLYQPSVKN